MKPPTLASVLAGFEYIRSRRRLLGVITLDLFVVILGGATALLPIYARDILSSRPCRPRPVALGAGRRRIDHVYRACASSGHERHIGRKMFAVVGIFGVTTIVFGLSNLVPAIAGWHSPCSARLIAVSIVIRFSLVQIETP